MPTGIKLRVYKGAEPGVQQRPNYASVAGRSTARARMPAVLKIGRDRQDLPRMRRSKSVEYSDNPLREETKPSSRPSLACSWTPPTLIRFQLLGVANALKPNC